MKYVAVSAQSPAVAGLRRTRARALFEAQKKWSRTVGRDLLNLTPPQHSYSYPCSYYYSHSSSPLLLLLVFLTLTLTLLLLTTPTPPPHHSYSSSPLTSHSHSYSYSLVYLTLTLTLTLTYLLTYSYSYSYSLSYSYLTLTLTLTLTHSYSYSLILLLLLAGLSYSYSYSTLLTLTLTYDDEDARAHFSSRLTYRTCRALTTMRKRLPPEIGRPSFGLLLSMLGLVRGLGEWRRDIGTCSASSSQPSSQEDSLFPIGVKFCGGTVEFCGGGKYYRLGSSLFVTLIPQTLRSIPQTLTATPRRIRIPGDTAAATTRRRRRPTILSYSDAAMWAQEPSSRGARAELSRAHDKRTNKQGPRARSARRRPWAPREPLVTWAESPEEDAMAEPRPQGLGNPPGLHQAAVAAGGGAQAAVAAGGGAGAAVAATREDLDALPVTQPFKLNNTALKWLRDTSENPPGFPTTRCVDITDADPLDIGVLDRTTGMAYTFRGGRRDAAMVMAANVGSLQTRGEGQGSGI